jgi:hypothetical protein
MWGHAIRADPGKRVAKRRRSSPIRKKSGKRAGSDPSPPPSRGSSGRGREGSDPVGAPSAEAPLPITVPWRIAPQGDSR